ncbi:MAG: hypothetical protein FWE70_03920, partial [Oscillospiraceae bacterium]|nr:hypothetical protein [Oscillospiraceae bacterium]
MADKGGSGLDAPPLLGKAGAAGEGWKRAASRGGAGGAPMPDGPDRAAGQARPDGPDSAASTSMPDGPDRATGQVRSDPDAPGDPDRILRAFGTMPIYNEGMAGKRLAPSEEGGGASPQGSSDEGDGAEAREEWGRSRRPVRALIYAAFLIACAAAVAASYLAAVNYVEG